MGRGRASGPSGGCAPCTGAGAAGVAEGSLNELCDGQGEIRSAEPGRQGLLHNRLDIARAVGHKLEEPRKEKALTRRVRLGCPLRYEQTP